MRKFIVGLTVLAGTVGTALGADAAPLFVTPAPRVASAVIVQRSAMATWTRLGQPDARSFRANLEADPEVAGRVPTAELDRAMAAEMHLRHVDHVFARVFGGHEVAMAAA